MRTRSRVLDTAIVKSNTYESVLASRAYKAEHNPDGEPIWPFMDYVDGSAPPDIHSYGYRRLITDSEHPSKLRSTETITDTTNLPSRTLSGMLDYTVYSRCHHTRVRYTPRESYYQGGLYEWRWYNKELRDLRSVTDDLWYPGLYGNTVTTKASYTVSDDQFREAANSALLNLLAGKPQRPMNLALAVCELKDLGQTVKQLCHFTKWCVKAIRGPAVRTGSSGFLRLMSTIRRQGFRANMRHLAEAYLWESFGVEPTIRDVENFISDVSNGKLHVGGAKPQDRLVPGHTAKSWFKARSFEYDEFGKPKGFPSLDVPWNYQQTTYKHWIVNTKTNCQFNWKVDTDEYRGCVFARLHPEKFERYKKYFPTDFNWGNPLFRTAWELVPFSFVVDWFIDVGAAIQRLDDLSYVSWTRLAWEEPWISVARVKTEWYPLLDRRREIILGDVKPRTGSSGWQDAQYTFHGAGGLTGSWYVGKRSITYDRLPASELGVSYWQLLRGLIPERKVTFKRYQLTTGMALVVSMSKLFR